MCGEEPLGDMFRGAAVTLVMFLVVAAGVGPSLAAPHNPYSLTDQDLMANIIMNQLKIIKGLNESTSSIASHGDEMNQLREDVEKRFQVMNETVEGMTETLQTGITALNETVSNEIQHATGVRHQRPDPDDLYGYHNDTRVSLCNGHKVLYGSEGYLEVTSSGNYPSNAVCSWTVTLPEGSRPVFRWYYLDIQKCSPCSKCDIVFVGDINHRRHFTHCGDIPLDGSFLTVMNNKFLVWFQSDGSVTGRGFKLQYRAVEMNY